MRIVLFLLLSLQLVAVKFKETKFIEALELETYRYGTLEHNQKQTVIRYKDGKTVTKRDHILTVHNRNNKLLNRIDLDKKPQIALFFRLTKALFLKNFSALGDDFEIEKNHLHYTFRPKPHSANIVNKIDLQLKEDGSVRYFIIDFANRDNIKIETL